MITKSQVRSDLTVLYLEDEPLIALDGESILGDIGFSQVNVASNLADAVAIADRGPVDVALLDVNLGDGTTSIDLAKRLVSSGTRVVFASGYNANEDMTGGLDVPTLPKPFTELMLDRAFKKLDV
ncbi:MAG: response regulator [Pseudomonadota bacterium]